MKKPFLVFLLAVESITGFAQGKVTVINDGASLVILSTDTALIRAPDTGLAGQAVGNAVPLPSGVVLMAGLYAGTSFTAPFYYYPPNSPAAALLNNASQPAGTIGPFQVQLNANPATGAPAIPGIALGTAIGSSTPWFQVRVWDSAYATFAAAIAGGAYWGEGPIFQMNPGSSIAYPFTSPAGLNSTWFERTYSAPGVARARAWGAFSAKSRRFDSLHLPPAQVTGPRLGVEARLARNEPPDRDAAQWRDSADLAVQDGQPHRTYAVSLATLRSGKRSVTSGRPQPACSMLIVTVGIRWLKEQAGEGELQGDILVAQTRRV
jgi:hypothetical protein